MWFATSTFVITFTIFILSIRFGKGPILAHRDLVPLGLAAGALVIWALTDAPAYTLFLAIGINSLGSYLTLIKAYQAPMSETLSNWVLGGIAAGFGIMSVEDMDIVLLAYPVYLLLLSLAVCLAVWFGQRVGKTRAQPTTSYPSTRVSMPAE